MSCFRKQPGCNILSAVHSVSSARRGGITAPGTTSPLPWGDRLSPSHQCWGGRQKRRARSTPKGPGSMVRLQ